MKPLTLRTGIYVAIDALLLAICLLHIPNVLNRPNAPFEVEEHAGRIVVHNILDQRASGEVQTGDVLLSWEGKRILMPEMEEYIADLSTTGSSIHVSLERNGTTYSSAVALIPYYPSPRFLIISLFNGLTMFVVGLFILLNRPGDVAARALHWSMITFGTTIMVTWGAITPYSWETYLSRTVWFITYLGVAVAFFFFTLTFPRMRIRWLAEHSWLMVVAVVAFGTLFAISHLSALHAETADSFVTFQFLFDLFHVSLFVFIGGGVVNIARASMRAATSEERQQLYWIFWGLLIGTAPYLLLHILPQVALSQYLVPEEYTSIFFLAVPVAFAISFLKYRLFDIEVVVNRTIVYAVLSVFIVATYILVVLMVTSIIGGEIVFEKYLLVAGLTLVVGLLVNPLRLKLQHVVDETLFAARANYRRAVTRITAELHRSLNRDDLFGRVVEAVHRVVPSEMLAAYGVEDGTLALQSFLGTRPTERCSITEDLKRALVERRVLAKRNVVRGELPHVDISREGFLDDCGWSVCVGVAAEGGELLGVLAVSPRLPREHYDEEELDLLLAVGSEAAEILERLTLQQKIILAQEEQKRSEELSALKSYFISSVSHELRMPLTSIRMFAETLRSGKAGSPRRQREYLEIIEGESERLSRLIGNILDFAKIERGVKEYAFTEVHLEEIMRRSVNAMRYQFEKHKGRLRTRVKKGIPVVTADGDALEEAVLNLLSNALKYSTLRKEVSVSLFERHHQVVIEVADKGIGIPESELGNIFDRFYRVRDDRTRQVGGAGLGLALVKHIVDAHHGTLSVKSKVGRGSTFTITLPIRQPKGRKQG